MSLSSDEVNYLIYRYMQENGYNHSAFTFAYESLVAKSSIAQSEIPPGALISFLQKGLEYVGIEENINEDGTVNEFDGSYSLLSPFICDAIATKEERRTKRSGTSSSTEHALPSSPMKMEDSINGDGSEHKNGTVAIPSIILLKSENDLRYLHLTGHQGEVFSCVWNPTMTQLASGSSDGMCRLWGLWEMNNGKWTSQESEIALRTAILPHSSYPGERFKDVTSVSWSPDGMFLATGCYDGIVRIWDNQGNLLTLLKEHTGPVFSLKWTKTGNYILSGSYDRRSIVWDANSGAVVKAFLLHAAPILDLDWKDSDTFATCSSDMAIHVCSVSTETTHPIKTFLGHTDEVNAVTWSPGGIYLASCSDDSTAKIWSVEKGGDSGLLHDLRGHLKEIYTVRWTPTGPMSANPTKPLLLCTASFDGTVKAWSAITGGVVYNLRRQAQPVYSIAPSPTGDYIATGSLGGYVSVWSLHDGSLVHESKGGGDTFDVSWSHDEGMLCACFSSGILQVLDYSSVLTRNNSLSNGHHQHQHHHSLNNNNNNNSNSSNSNYRSDDQPQQHEQVEEIVAMSGVGMDETETEVNLR